MSSITESIKLRVILIRYFNKILNDLVMLCCSVDAILTSQWFNMPISVYDKNITDLQSKMSTYLRFKIGKDKIYFSRIYHETVSVTLLYLPCSMQGTSITDILKINLCYVFTEWLTHHITFKILHFYQFLLKALLNFVIEKKYF